MGVTEQDRFEYECYSQLRGLSEPASWRVLDAVEQLRASASDRGRIGKFMRWVTDARYRAARRTVTSIRESLGPHIAATAQQLACIDAVSLDRLENMLSVFWDLRRGTTDPAANARRPEGNPQAIVGNYELFEIIGEGAMGRVYRAWQNPPGRVVALKLIRRDQHVSDVAQRQFEREAAKAGQLDYPGLVPVLDAGTTDQFSFYAMPLVHGKTLRTHLEENGVVAEHDAARIVRSVATAIDYAHEQGVIHCDLKPENIMLDANDPGREGIGLPRVTDFGVARSLASADDGILLGGTPAYMAPELPSIRQDGRGDIYALGVILLELVNGENPFLGLDGDEMLLCKRGGPDSIERFVDSKAAPDLLAIIGKCLQSNARQRYAHSRALADDLDRFLQGRPVTARVISTGERVSKWARRSPWQASALALLLLALIVVQHARRLERQALVDQSLGQVDALIDSRIEAVPAILDSLPAVWEIVEPRLRQLLAENSLTSTQENRVRLALARKDRHQLEHLQTAMSVADCEELVVLLERLRPYRSELLKPMLARVDETDGGDSSRLRAAVGVAAYDHENSRWNGALPEFVTRQMLEVESLELDQWTQAFVPVREHLMEPLVDQYFNSDDVAKETRAAEILARYAKDDVRRLCELAVNGKPHQFNALLRLWRNVPRPTRGLARRNSLGKTWRNTRSARISPTRWSNSSTVQRLRAVWATLAFWPNSTREFRLEMRTFKVLGTQHPSLPKL